jgi:hypothetical protein
MIQRTRIIQNKNLNAAYSPEMEMVNVCSLTSGINKVFAGFSTLHELYQEFEENFSEHTTYADAVKHFTPTIGQTIIK